MVPGLSVEEIDEIETATNGARSAANTQMGRGRRFDVTLAVPATGCGVELSLARTRGKVSILSAAARDRAFSPAATLCSARGDRTVSPAARHNPRP